MHHIEFEQGQQVDSVGNMDVNEYTVDLCVGLKLNPAQLPSPTPLSRGGTE